MMVNVVNCAWCGPLPLGTIVLPNGLCMPCNLKPIGRPR